MLLADTEDNMCIAEPAAGTAEPAGKDTVGQIEAPVLDVLAGLAVVLVLLAGLVIQTADTDILGIAEELADIPDTVDILGIAEDTVDILGIAEDTVDIPDTAYAAYAACNAEDIHEEYQE